MIDHSARRCGRDLEVIGYWSFGDLSWRVSARRCGRDLEVIAYPGVVVVFPEESPARRCGRDLEVIGLSGALVVFPQRPPKDDVGWIWM